MMTAIKGFMPANRRLGEVGVHSIDHYALVAPNVAEAGDFYAAFGLDVRGSGHTLELYTQDNSHCWGNIAEGPRKKLHYISFGAFADDMPRFRERLDAMGVERLPAPKGFETNGIWFQDPDGLLLEVRPAEKSSPNAKASFECPSAPPNVRGALPRKLTPPARPKRFSHMAIYSRDIQRSIDFYSRALGLRVSDRAADIIAFLHGIHGSDHHMLAFVTSHGPGLHHSSWEMGSIQNIGLGAMQMAAEGHEAGWGLGRHVLGSNYFHYVRDPWGSYAEYTADMDYVPVDKDWAAEVHDAEDSFYLWAGKPPEDFARNYEIE
jgi:catechol 2,3-dioxygenase-like lactoylglutathione lyase family enzyme